MNKVLDKEEETVMNRCFAENKKENIKEDRKNMKGLNCMRKVLGLLFVMLMLTGLFGCSSSKMTVDKATELLLEQGYAVSDPVLMQEGLTDGIMVKLKSGGFMFFAEGPKDVCGAFVDEYEFLAKDTYQPEVRNIKGSGSNRTVECGTFLMYAMAVQKGETILTCYVPAAGKDEAIQLVTLLGYYK